MYRRELRIPLELPERFDPAPLVVRLGRGRVVPGPRAEPSVLERRRLRFFDFETTGLSGGAGTVAFLAAIAWAEKGELRTEQFFLLDYPGERTFLDAFASRFDDESVLVSHNGKAFDWPLFRSRCIMSGRRIPGFALHIDLLATARRLWRSRAGGASLGELEAHVLGKRRLGDIPGAEIPAAYLSFLESGDPGRLPAVCSHNAEDVASLAALFGQAVELFANPPALGREVAVDEGNLGRILLAIGREEEALAILRRAAEGGDERAALVLAGAERRAGRLAEAASAASLAGGAFEALLEGARIAEASGDLDAAIDAAQAAARIAGTTEKKRRALGRARRLGIRIAAISKGRPGRRRSGSPAAGIP